MSKMAMKLAFNTSQDLSGFFNGRGLIIRVSPQYWAYTQSLEREKLISNYSPAPRGTWLQMTGAQENLTKSVEKINNFSSF